MLFITYSQSSANREHWDHKKLAASGITFITMSDLLDKEEIEKDKLYLCPVDILTDDWSDLKICNHLLDHPRILFHLNRREDILLALDRNLSYVLLSPKDKDRTMWRLSCGYDELSEDQQKEWDADWKLFTQTLLKSHLLSSVVFLKNENTTLEDCGTLLRGFM